MKSLALSADMVRSYRQQGYLYVPNAIPTSALDVLRSAAADTVARRGAYGSLPLNSSQVRSPSPQLSSSRPPPGGKRTFKTIRARLRYEDRVLRRQYGLSDDDLRLSAPPLDTKKILSVVSMRKKSPTQAQISAALISSTRGQQLVEAFNASERSFFYTWKENPTLREFVTGGSLGAALGEAMSQLLGTLSVRMYSDMLSLRFPLSGWTPLLLNTATEHRCVSVVIPLTGHSEDDMMPFMHVLPGSHHAVGAALQAGKLANKDGSPYSSSIALSSLPELKSFEGAMIPFPEQGSCLFLHNFLVRSLYPVMSAERRGVGSQSLLDEAVQSYFTVSAIPDGLLHDGQSRGWLTDDRSGPLYGKKKGDAINDPENFPLLYVAEALS